MLKDNCVFVLDTLKYVQKSYINVRPDATYLNI